MLLKKQASISLFLFHSIQFKMKLKSKCFKKHLHPPIFISRIVVIEITKNLKMYLLSLTCQMQIPKRISLFFFISFSLRSCTKHQVTDWVQDQFKHSGSAAERWLQRCGLQNTLSVARQLRIKVWR